MQKPNRTKHMPKEKYFQRVQAVSKQVERVRKSSLEYAQTATPGWKKILRAKRRKKQARKGHHFTKAEYAQYLKTEHWITFRQTALERAKYACEECAATGVLHVHHLTYKRVWKERAGDVQVLCESCHKAKHPKWK